MTANSGHIEIAFTRIQKPFSKVVYESYQTRLPAYMQLQNERFVRWQDRHAHLMGRILLISASRRLGWGETILEDLCYNEFGKPSLQGLNFNNSHSGEFVVCASTTSDIVLGVDIEQNKPLDFTDYLNTMSSQQWKYINCGNERPDGALDRFYSYWVIKESVIKAQGGGLSVPLTDIEITNDMAIIAGGFEKWHFLQVPIHPAYAMAIATSRKVHAADIFIKEFESLPADS